MVDKGGYTKLFDKFIVTQCAQRGFDAWAEIKHEVLKSKLFWNNWWLRSKTDGEIKQRVLKLLHLLDADALQKNKRKTKKKTKAKKKAKSKSRSPSKEVSSSTSSSLVSTKNRKRLSKAFVQNLVST